VAKPEDRVDLAAFKISEVPAILRLLTPSGSRVAWQEERVDLSVFQISVVPATQGRQTLQRSPRLLSELYLG